MDQDIILSALHDAISHQSGLAEPFPPGSSVHKLIWEKIDLYREEIKRNYLFPDIKASRSYSHVAERALLGAIFINNAHLYTISEYLQSEHFYEPAHCKIYETASKMIRMGEAANPITVRSRLPQIEKVGETPIGKYLAFLTAVASPDALVADYGQTIFDLAELRRENSN